MYKIYVDNVMICDSRISELAINDPTINLELNTAGSFTFSFPPGHPFRNRINHLKSVIKVINNGEMVFKGYCCGENEDMLGNKYIECNGELAYLNDSVLEPYRWQNKTVTQLLTAYLTGYDGNNHVIDGHNDQVEARKQIKVGNITVTDPNNSISCYTNMNPCVQEIKEDLIDDLGGYIFLRYEIENGAEVKYLDYLSQPLINAPQTVELGKNLVNYDSNLNDDEIATKVIPLGAMLEEEVIEGLSTRLDITGLGASTVSGCYHPAYKNYIRNNNNTSNFGYISRVVTWDDVHDASILLTKGRKWLTDNQFQNVTITVRAIDLSLVDPNTVGWHIFDNVHVISEYHGMDRWFILSKIVMYLNNPENNEYTLGINKSKVPLSVKTNGAISGVTDVRKEILESEQSWLSDAQARVTAIMNGSKGGIVVTEFDEYGRPTELRIQDDLDTPTKIWRWNIGGFAYSNDGGQSWGSAAITMNGEIVANFITTGEMSAARIKAGILTDLAGKFSLNMTTGALTMSDATFNGGSIKVGYDNPDPSQNKYKFQVQSNGNVSASNIDVGYSLKIGTRNSIYDEPNVLSTIHKMQTQYIRVYERVLVSYDTTNHTPATLGFVYEYTDEPQLYFKMTSASRLTVYLQGGSTYGTIQSYISNPSSIKIKKDIIDISEEVIQGLLKAIPIEYNTIGENKHRLGFVAEDLYEVLPDVVDMPDDYDEDKPYEAGDVVPSIDYAQLIAPLVAIVQRQEKRIAELERRLDNGEH